MRVLRRFPTLEPALRDGRLCLSTASLLGQVLTEENATDLVERAAYRTKAEVEHLVASVRPRAAPREGIRKLPEPATSAKDYAVRVIVDYANVFQSLEKALAIYGAAAGIRTPVREKDALVDELRAAIAELEAFCAAAGVRLADIEASGNALDRLTRVGEAANALLAPDERRKAFLAHARLADRLFAAIKPHRTAAEFAVRMSTVTALAERIRTETAPEQADLGGVLRRIGEVLDRSIEGADIVRDGGPPPIDLSRIDFQARAERFRASTTKNLDLERLKAEGCLTAAATAPRTRTACPRSSGGSSASPRGGRRTAGSRGSFRRRSARR